MAYCRLALLLPLFLGVTITWAEEAELAFTDLTSVSSSKAYSSFYGYRGSRFSEISLSPKGANHAACLRLAEEVLLKPDATLTVSGTLKVSWDGRHYNYCFADYRCKVDHSFDSLAVISFPKRPIAGPPPSRSIASEQQR